MKGIWPSERVNSQVDCLRADLSETSALTFIVKCFGQDQESRKTPDSNSLSQSVRSHPLEFLPLSLLPFPRAAVWPSALTLSRPSALFLFRVSCFRSRLVSRYVSVGQGRTIKLLRHLTVLERSKVERESFRSRDQAATRQYETLIVERSVFGNGLCGT